MDKNVRNKETNRPHIKKQSNKYSAHNVLLFLRCRGMKKVGRFTSYTWGTLCDKALYLVQANTISYSLYLLLEV